MTLLDKIQEDIVVAMKSHDQVRLDTLRSIKTALDKHRTDQRKPIDDIVEQKILSIASNQRREAADAFRKGNREISAQREELELKIIESYMHEQVSDAELDTILTNVVRETNPTISQFGAAMKYAQNLLKGKRVDNKVLSDKLRALLQNV